MQDLSIFKFEDQEVRTVIRDGEPWFVAKDVSDALGYSAASAMIRHLDDDEGGVSIVHTPSKNQHGEYEPVEQQMSIISESGLYHAIFNSRKEGAKEFRKWVTSEVLPSIRKTGAYHADKWYAAIDVYNAGKKARGKAPQSAMSQDFSQTLVWAREQPGMSDAIKGNNGEYFIREDMAATVLFACSTVTERGQLTGKGDHVLEVVRRNAWITGKKADHLVETSIGGVFRGPNTLQLEA